MAEQNKKKKKSGNGFYVGLCCIVAAIGIVGFVNSRNEEVPTEDVMPVIPENIIQAPVITVTPETELVAEPEKELPVIAPKKEAEQIVIEPEEEPDVIESGENPEFYDGAVVESVSVVSPPEFMCPVDGEIYREFSGGQLYYDTVMGDYRTHNGVDISADGDEDVVASADGVVEAVYDGILGKTVVLNHNNGYKTVYANLDDITNITQGMEFEAGEFIAHVGNGVYGEESKGTHIHFELMLDDEFLNPVEYFK